MGLASTRRTAVQSLEFEKASVSELLEFAGAGNGFVSSNLLSLQISSSQMHRPCESKPELHSCTVRLSRRIANFKLLVAASLSHQPRSLPGESGQIVLL